MHIFWHGLKPPTKKSVDFLGDLKPTIFRGLLKLKSKIPSPVDGGVCDRIPDSVNHSAALLVCKGKAALF